MKNIILILIVVFTINNINGQEVNRHTELTTSKYTPISASNNYYLNTENRSKKVFENVAYYHKKISREIQNENDEILKRDLIKTRRIFDVFFDEKPMSIAEAENRIKHFIRSYNKAIKDYNKRVKKYYKELEKSKKKKEKESRKKRKKN